MKKQTYLAKCDACHTQIILIYDNKDEMLEPTLCKTCKKKPPIKKIVTKYTKIINTAFASRNKELAALHKELYNNDILEAYKHSSKNHKEIQQSTTCGCFYCLKIIKPQEIKNWIKNRNFTTNHTAICPHCGIDSIIGSKSKYPITTQFLTKMQQHWFTPQTT